jgi:hypothetical protein
MVCDELGLARLVFLPNYRDLIGLGFDVLVNAVHCRGNWLVD